MTSRFARFGNALYSGERSLNFVGWGRFWFFVAAAMMIISVVIPVAKGGFNFGIEFRGGSQFQVSEVANPKQDVATKAVASVAPEEVAKVSVVGSDGVRVQTDQLSDAQTKLIADALAVGYKVPASNVTHTFIGPTWGADVSKQAIVGLVVFLVLALIIMAFYFRTWKMSLAAILSLIHDLVVTAGVYALTGFEITPAALIGFLTILAYSLYDTVVVFDKIKENTAEEAVLLRHTFAESVNLAVNQTLVRSINTGVVAVLPVGTILFVGAYVLGADTLRDISLALLIGIILGTYSTIFIAAPLYAWFRQGEPEIRKHDAATLKARSAAAKV
ncbi:MAG: protein translocase subunit SecF [Microbacteriaceae bacterium]|nr:protein translocase subunit SecF [Cryobacterium sp.]MBX3104393.1 protein translocase subunit SecF [Cryobacterium sp.]MCC6375923.1 protein translocase subunit SecF [Microbacteriaceae bacterium]